MTDRLLNVLDPEDLDRSTRTIGWIAGEVLGVLIAISALALLLAVVHLG
jgi:cobalamin synthase